MHCFRRFRLWPATIAWATVFALLPTMAAEIPSAPAQQVPLREESPAVIFSSRPALLARVDGAAQYAPAQGTTLERVINTPVLLLRDGAGRHYLRVFDGWMTATTLQGPWTVLAMESGDLRKVREEAQTHQTAELLDGKSTATKEWNGKIARPSLTRVPVPVVFVATAPTELIVTDGNWSWSHIPGTPLMYVRNTAASIVRDNADPYVYVLLAGGWFRARSSAGPWTAVAAGELPADFAWNRENREKAPVTSYCFGRYWDVDTSAWGCESYPYWGLWGWGYRGGRLGR